MPYAKNNQEKQEFWAWFEKNTTFDNDQKAASEPDAKKRK